MPYTQKGKKAKRNKKKTKKLKKQNGGEGGLKIIDAIKFECPPDLAILLETKETRHTNDKNEVDYDFEERSITIEPFDEESPSIDYPDEKFTEITPEQLKMFTDNLTEILKDISNEISPPKTTTKLATLTIKGSPEFIESHSYSNVENLLVQLDNEKDLEIKTETPEEGNPPAPPETKIEFKPLFPKKLNENINLEDPETLAILGAHLPFNFFPAVFSSNTLKTVTLKHKDFTEQTEEKEIDGIKFKFANA